jgi:hypothetical protein
MISYLIAICGTLISLPIILFFGIGAKTFVRPGEKALAGALLWFGTGLLGLSLATFFQPRLATADLIAVLAALSAYFAMWYYAKRGR